MLCVKFILFSLLSTEEKVNLLINEERLICINLYVP